MAGLFQVLWGQADGQLSAAQTLNGTDDQPLIISAPPGNEDYDSDIARICTRPMAVDWDGDGDLDLVVGNFLGTFFLFRGEGEGKFQPTSELLMVGNDVLRINGHHSDPFCVDWDGDGDLDLLSGSSTGGVQLAENTAGPGRFPELKSFEMLIEPGTQEGTGEMLQQSELTAPTRSTRIWVDDIDADGKLDILVGDSTTLVSPADGLTDAECKEREAAWRERLTAMITKINEFTEDVDPDEQQQAYTAYSELYRERQEFIKEDRTGFVWMYRQR